MSGTLILCIGMGWLARNSVNAEAFTYNFLSLGDWGGAALGGQDAINVQSVAAEMATVATQFSPSMILNLGDNFYWCGIQNTSDFQIDTDFVKPYAAESLQLPWYSILGNHEYGYNVEAQLEYSSLNKNWIMDDRYYTRRLELDPTTKTYGTFIFLDTSPCVSAYRSSSSSGWDPCGSEYPTCSLASTDDDFEGPCEFHNNIMTQNCGTQYDWLKNQLTTVPSTDWLIIAGHHPLDELNVEDFTSLLQSHGFSIYINGHAHTLTQYTIDYKGVYVTTGAGSLVNTADQTTARMLARVKGIDDVVDNSAQIDSNLAASSHTYQTVFNLKVAGFTHHIFSSDYSKLTTNFMSYTGEIVHTFNSNRAGSVVN